VSDAFLAELRRAAGGTAARLERPAGPDAPRALVEPRDRDALAAVMARCTDAGVPVAPAGARSWLQHGSAAGRVVVSTRRLAGVTEYEPADLVVGVHAGTPGEELEGRLRTQGQTLPLDPAGWERGSIGAAAALNAAGPLRTGCGTLRDMTLGAELVTGDGRLLRFGGRVVKNVAGYDAVRLIVGSRGTLGMITALYLRIRAAPAADRTMILDTPDLHAAAELALAIRDSGDADSLEILAAHGGTWRIAVRCRGGTEAVDEAVTTIRRLHTGPAEETGPGFWKTYAAPEADAALLLTVTGRPGDLVPLLEAGTIFCNLASGQDLDRSARAWTVRAHAADGILRIAGPATLPGLHGAAAELGRTAVTHNWTWRYEAVPAAAERPADCRPAPGAATLMRRIAAAFDPAGILPRGAWEVP
jgi:FAD/FMN-containing dehydrogenase